MNRTVRIGGIAVALAVTLVSASACDWGDKANEPFQDAARTGVVNNAPVDIITDADGFSNIATKCDHGNRLYMAYHGSDPYAAITVVPKDPTCAGR